MPNQGGFAGDSRILPLLRNARRSLAAIAALVVGCLLVFATAASAKPFEFKPATHGVGTLQQIGKVPVLIVRGTPDQMGEQLGVLLAQPLGEIFAQRDALLRGFGLGAFPQLLTPAAALLSGNFPADHLAELKTTSQSSQVSLDFLLAGNVIYDVAKIGGCSALLVERDRSATGEILFGRNMDFPTFGFLDHCGVLVVYAPKGKHAFASVTFPGFLGCISGMNDAGLAVAELEVNSAADDSQRFDWSGVPLALIFRRVLEECTTLDEAEKLLRSIPRTAMCNLAVCDRRSTAVFEMTTKSLERRPAVAGFCACTNHFRTSALSTDKTCDRYEKLAGAFDRQKVDLADVARKLNEVNQGRQTIHTMIFEPQSLRLHLSMGPGPASSRPLEVIELEPLFHAPDAAPDEADSDR